MRTQDQYSEPMTGWGSITAGGQSDPSGWAIALNLVPSLVAVGIAVTSFLMNSSIRRKDKAEREKELAAAEERRALRDAQKVVWTYKNLDEDMSCISIINAGSGPILGLALFAARMPNGDGIDWMTTDEAGSSTPVILSGQSHGFEGKWVRRQGLENIPVPIAVGERPTQGVLCELHWTDDSGHVWDTDNEFAQVHLSRIIGAEERAYTDPDPTPEAKQRWWKRK